MPVDPLLSRFQNEFESNQNASRRAAAVEKETRTRQVQVEASRALKSAMTNDVAETASPVEPIQPVTLQSAPSSPKESLAVAEEWTCSTHELALRTDLLVRLQVAENRIGELDRELKDARRKLKEHILQDQSEEIQMQRHVIGNLKAELSDVEEERDALRKQFLESDTRVYELERRHRCLQESQVDLRNQENAIEDGITQAGDLNNYHRPTCGGKANARLQPTRKTKLKPPKLARRAGGFGLYVMT